LIKLKEQGNSLIFTVRVIPRSSKSEIAGELDRMLKIRLAAPPVEGAANAELIKFLSKTFGISKSNVHILSGEMSRTKQIEIAGLDKDKFLKVVL
jgi:uncharacterized protein